MKENRAENFTNSNGPVPMQLALTPFPPNVDVAKLLAVLKEKAGSTGNALPERKKIPKYVYAKVCDTDKKVSR
jgi:hypothetical protein